MNRNSELKILQLGKFYPIGVGVEKVMYDLMQGLSGKGVFCDMLCAACAGESQTVVLNDHATLMCCRTWVKLAATMIAPEMIFRLRKIARQYDIIHVHHPDPMACLALFCSGYKGKVVLHWHSDILKQRMWLKLYKPLQDWLLRRADLIVGTTPVYLKESPFLQHVQEKTHCLPIGVKPVICQEKRVKALKALYSGKKIIFSLGRLIGYKGFSYLIDAARYLDEDYMILIGGAGPLRSELQQQIDSLNLSGKVKLLGFISDEDLPSYYGACDLFCMSSVQKTEAFGIVQIEAMSCHKPVVATKIPESGVSWVNADGVSGINVEPGNAEALALAIRRILENTDYEHYCLGAAKRYSEMFTYECMINNCLKIYQTCRK